MLKFLFIAFFILPSGNIQMAKRPVSSVAECDMYARIAAKEANEAGALFFGECIKPSDFVVRTNT